MRTDREIDSAIKACQEAASSSRLVGAEVEYVSSMAMAGVLKWASGIDDDDTRRFDTFIKDLGQAEQN